MSSQNVATTAVYMAYNTSTGAYVTGDVANHTLKLVKDGTEANPTNSPAEVDATNTPGAYKLALTAGETQFGTVWLGGKSSTSNVIIVPITLTFEILPTALDANSFVKADVEDWKGATAPANTGDAFARLGAPAGASVSADIAAVKSDTGTILTDVNTGAGAIYNRIGAPVGASISADIAAVKTDLDAGVNTTKINGNATAAANVSKANQAIVRGTCSGGTTATAVCSAITSPASLTDAGQLTGRTIIFDSDTVTANLQGQASNITNSTTGATPTITFTAMTHAPANGDTFSVV